MAVSRIRGAICCSCIWTQIVLFSSVHFFFSFSYYYYKGHTDDLFTECISVKIQSIKKWALHRPRLNVINARPKQAHTFKGSVQNWIKMLSGRSYKKDGPHDWPIGCLLVTCYIRLQSWDYVGKWNVAFKSQLVRIRVRCQHTVHTSSASDSARNFRPLSRICSDLASHLTSICGLSRNSSKWLCHFLHRALASLATASSECLRSWYTACPAHKMHHSHFTVFNPSVCLCESHGQYIMD